MSRLPDIKKFFLHCNLANICFLCYAIWFYFHNNFLPAPLFYDISDTFMDLYHTLFWTVRDSRYEDWHAIYPIFVFLVGKILLIGNTCIENVENAFDLRYCDRTPVYYLILVYLIGASFVAMNCVKLIFVDQNNISKICSFFMILIFNLTSIPSLYAIERGNLIVFAFAALSVMTCYKSRLIRSVALAFAINIKQYLVVLIFPLVLRKRYVSICLLTILIVIFNVFSLEYLGEEHYVLLIENMFRFSAEAPSLLSKIWMNTSIFAYQKLLDRFVDYSGYENLIFFLLSGLVALKAMIAFLFLRVLVCQSKSSNPIPDDALCFYMVLFLLVFTDSVGGYGSILLTPFLPSAMLHFRQRYCLFAFYALFLPIEFPIGYGINIHGVSFLSDLFVNSFSSYSISMLTKPVFYIAAYLIFTRSFIIQHAKN